MEAFGTETMRPSTAAQCVAYIAITELPAGLWSDLIPTLTSNVTNPGSTEMMKESTLEAIGYICQDIVRSNTTGQPTRKNWTNFVLRFELVCLGVDSNF